MSDPEGGAWAVYEVRVKIKGYSEDIIRKDASYTRRAIGFWKPVLVSVCDETLSVSLQGVEFLPKGRKP